jgi:hypothetical protein
MMPKPVFDEFDDLVLPSKKDAVCQVRRQVAAMLCTAVRAELLLYM